MPATMQNTAALELIRERLIELRSFLARNGQIVRAGIANNALAEVDAELARREPARHTDRFRDEDYVASFAA